MVENEIQYVPWSQFRQMVPSILGLEVMRLSRCIDRSDPQADLRNELVQARFSLRKFIACVEQASQDGVEACSPLLESALLQVLPSAGHQPELDYVIDRLTYVQDRIPYIY
ncbi:MAG: hypothetical protein OXM02_04215 [Bacteroidota bacterium]|nr:hypothetical protein [Bacteroidota bacterium]MDE2833706.1 hypothetical protein [Bacteroidota bacterium]MDE2957291.1 hypothetical protein [Bacteroidota bacterium]